MKESSPVQKILFGSPGTGKSHHVKEIILPDLDIVVGSDECISTVFHPEYSYGDFMGKLVPNTRDGQVEYKFRPGHFLKALAQAYKHILDGSNKNVALVIDEINRGNSAAIFGTVFQLLDRNEDGWSSYEVALSDLEFDTLLKEMDFTISYRTGGDVGTTYIRNGVDHKDKAVYDVLSPIRIKNKQIKLPKNLSLIATMNNSDNSIYYMDTAFKRRWEWQFIDNDSELVKAYGDAFKSKADWDQFVAKLNSFLRSSHNSVRRAEDKQIGKFFINFDITKSISKAQIQNKVMFYLWDSVFTTSRAPLVELLGNPPGGLVTFGDFAALVDEFILAIQKR